MTPLDIKKQEFTRSFRGVDAQEVYNFLQMVGDQWDHLLDENRRLEQKVKEYDNKLEHYRKIEEALQEALETARDNSHKTIENAQREAQIILKEARSASEEIRKKASTDHKRLKHDISKISGRRDEVVARLRAFLMSELELLARFEGQDPMGGYVRLDAGESKRLRGHDEVNINASYRSQAVPVSPVEDPPVDLPVSEEETSFQETETADPFAEIKSSNVSSNPGMAHRHYPIENSGSADAGSKPSVGNVSSSEGLSTDELEFIKSTVSSATQKPVADDIFKPAEPEVDQAWNQSVSRNFEPNGATHAGDGKPGRAPGERSLDGSGAGWIVKPSTSSNSATPKPPAPPPKQPNLGGFASPLFGSDDDQDDLSATPEEIEKIRRILNDLD